VPLVRRWGPGQRRAARAGEEAGAGRRALAPWNRASDTQTLACVLAGGTVHYTMLLTCFIGMGETRQRRPTGVPFVFICFLGGYVWWRIVADEGPSGRLISGACCDTIPSGVG
jgi:hypothetical protein